MYTIPVHHYIYVFIYFTINFNVGLKIRPHTDIRLLDWPDIWQNPVPPYY
jgi:hypothetical protein